MVLIMKTVYFHDTNYEVRLFLRYQLCGPFGTNWVELFGLSSRWRRSRLTPRSRLCDCTSPRCLGIFVVLIMKSVYVHGTDYEDCLFSWY